MSVKVAITIGPFEFVAAMEEQAPLTCAAFREILPFQAKTIHFRWSGEAVWSGSWPLVPGCKGSSWRTCYLLSGLQALVVYSVMLHRH